jgi:hypothetical protein
MVGAYEFLNLGLLAHVFCEQVLANYGVLLTLLFGRLVQRIFFGPLTNQEVEVCVAMSWLN